MLVLGAAVLGIVTLFRQTIEEGKSLANEALVEHMCAENLISQIQNTESDDELFDAKVKVLAEYVKHHIQEEEKEMLPKFKKADVDLVSLGKEMAARNRQLAGDSI